MKESSENLDGKSISLRDTNLIPNSKMRRIISGKVLVENGMPCILIESAGTKSKRIPLSSVSGVMWSQFTPGSLDGMIDFERFNFDE